MSWEEFWIVLACCGGTMLACRTLPMFLLKGRELPRWLERTLGFVPPAAFAALVANDLLAPDMFEPGLWPAALPLVAAIPVAVVALKTRSLLWSALTGLVAFALLMLI